MGILDDAIREHLDLMRQLGSDESELKRLEDEAFGPPARPGDPDFPGPAAVPESGEQTTDAGDGGADTDAQPNGAEAEPEAGAEPAVEPPESAHAPALAPEAVELEALSAAADDRAATVGEPTEVHETVEPAEPEDVGGTVADEPESGAPSEPEQSGGELNTREREAIAEQSTQLFEQTASERFGLNEIELDLDLEEEVERVTELDDEDDDLLSGGGEDHEDDEELEDEDVLEETPDFLRDQPEDDELWFEQGEPKDFDFD